MDREKVISTLEKIKTQTAEIGLDSAVIAHEFIDKIIALLKEQERQLDSIVCFEKGDKVRIWHCPLCKSEVRFVIKGQEAFKPVKGKTLQDSAFDCGACGYPLWEDENYCAHCGKPIDWKGE